MKPRSPRAHGLRTLAKGAVITLLAFGFVRIQALADAATYAVPCATILGVVWVGVGLFQMISGRPHEKGLGLVGIVFVALFGFVGAFLGFAVALKHDDPEPPPLQPTLTDDLAREIGNSLQPSPPSPRP